MLFDFMFFDAVFSNVIFSQSATLRIIKAKHVRLNIETTSMIINNLATIVKSAFEFQSHKDEKRNLNYKITKLKD